MANPAMKLDTLAYAKKLIEAGCDRKLAEAHASLQQDTLIEISEDYLSQFATKQDVEGIRIATKQDIGMLEERVDGKFKILEQKLETVVLKTKMTLGSIVAVGIGVLASIMGIIGILLKLHT